VLGRSVLDRCQTSILHIFLGCDISALLTDIMHQGMVSKPPQGCCDACHIYRFGLTAQHCCSSTFQAAALPLISR
jgi:hypothetical protein